jgi:uncharacterized membrane protein YgcG
VVFVNRPVFENAWKYWVKRTLAFCCTNMPRLTIYPLDDQWNIRRYILYDELAMMYGMKPSMGVDEGLVVEGALMVEGGGSGKERGGSGKEGGGSGKEGGGSGKEGGGLSKEGGGSGKEAEDPEEEMGAGEGKMSCVHNEFEGLLVSAWYCKKSQIVFKWVSRATLE